MRPSAQSGPSFSRVTRSAASQTSEVFLPLRVLSACIEIVEATLLPISIQGGKEGRPDNDGRQGLIYVVPVRRSIDVVADRLAQQRFHLDEVVPKVGLENAGREAHAVVPNVLETETECQHLLDTD